MTLSSRIAPVAPPHGAAPGLAAISAVGITTARGYVEASRAASTRLAYDGYWRREDAAATSTDTYTL
jgi:hypothetical protein